MHHLGHQALSPGHTAIAHSHKMARLAIGGPETAMLYGLCGVAFQSVVHPTG